MRRPERIQVINDQSDVDNVVIRDPDKVIWLSQTTLSVDETLDTVICCASGSR